MLTDTDVDAVKYVTKTKFSAFPSSVTGYSNAESNFVTVDHFDILPENNVNLDQ